MALFDELERAVAGGAGSGTAAPQGAIAAVAQMLQAYPGGIEGVIEQFEKTGLGGVAKSWIEQGGNQPVSGAQVQSALGSGAIDQVAAKLGVPTDLAAGHIAQLLPLVLDHLTPSGQAPSGGGLGAIEGLLGRFA